MEWLAEKTEGFSADTKMKPFTCRRGKDLWRYYIDMKKEKL